MIKNITIIYISTFLVNKLAINRLSCYLAMFSIFKVGNELLLHISAFIVLRLLIHC